MVVASLACIVGPRGTHPLTGIKRARRPAANLGVMELDTPQALVQHHIAELRGAYPRVTDCHFALLKGGDAAQPRHSLWLDIRWPQHQSIVSGPTCGSQLEAVRAGFQKARRILEDCHA
jgi:hypothetical protein